MQFQINPPQGRSSEIPTCRGRGVLKAKIIEVNCLVLNWNFLVKGEGEWGGGGGVQNKKPSVEGVWMFSGTAHCIGFPYMKCMPLHYK